MPRPIASADVRAALCAGLARAIGLAGMVGGQMLDLDAERSTAPLSVAAITRLQAMKTGALLSFSVEAGAMLAGADAGAERGALDLWARDRRGVSDRRRHSRRRGRRGDARQTRRQGRRAQQGDPRWRARGRGRAPRARLPGRGGGIGGRLVRSRRRGRRFARDRALHRNSKKLKRRQTGRAPISRRAARGPHL